MKPRWVAVAVFAMVLAGLLGNTALAQEIETTFKVVVPDPDPKKPKAPPGVPIIRAMVDVDIAGLSAAKFELRDTAREDIKVAPEKVVTFRESDERLALIVLVQGNFRWMGNESYADGETGAVYDGAFSGLSPAIDALAGAGPVGAKGALLVYTGGKVLPKVPMGPVKNLTGSSLGNQQAYEEYISKPLIVGLTESLSLLVKEPDSRRVLVVIGDGNDDAENIDGKIRKLVDDLKAAEVEVYSIHYTAVSDDSPKGQQTMARLGYTRNETATSRDNFKTYADSFVEFIGTRYYVDFPGADFPPGEHEVQLAILAKGEPLLGEAAGFEMPEYVSPKQEGGTRWWLWLLALIVLVVVIVVVVMLLRRRRSAPPQVMETPLPEPGMPQKQHTVMLGIGGNADSVPIVGWLIPMNGPYQFQTFKLLQGKTVIGTGGTAHIIVQDDYMTQEHCEIVSSPTGFVLRDVGSTNGTYLNSDRASMNDLIDNDVIRTGKTEFKFKSIN